MTRIESKAVVFKFYILLKFFETIRLEDQYVNFYICQVRRFLKIDKAIQIMAIHYCYDLVFELANREKA